MICHVLSKRSDLVDYRSKSHHRLFLEDDTFDHKHSALQKIKKRLSIIKEISFRKYSYEISKFLKESSYSYFTTETNGDSRPLDIVILHSGQSSNGSILYPICSLNL